MYVRQPSDTIKGQMYYDLKLDDWIFEIEESNGEKIADRVMEEYRDYQTAIDKVKALNQRIKAIYDQSLNIVKNAL